MISMKGRRESLRDMGWLVASTTVITACSSVAASSRVSARRPTLITPHFQPCSLESPLAQEDANRSATYRCNSIVVFDDEATRMYDVHMKVFEEGW